MKHIILSFLLLGLFSSAHADFIINTGPGPGGNPGGWSLSSSQYLAAKFIVKEKTTLKSIEGWMDTAGDPGTQIGTIALYGNTMADIPGMELFSTAFKVEGDSDASWQGIDGLGWMVDIGVYWAAFEVRENQTLEASMPFPAEEPLSGSGNFYAFFNTGNGMWRGGSQNFGIRIHSGDAVIPIPAAVWLFGSAMLGLVGWSHRKAKA